MADILKFEKEDIEILETFEHEEEIQRPEELRFYTLDEQLTDFFEKSLPAKLTRFEEKELRKLRDRARTAYEKTILVTDTDYVVDLRRKSLNLSWVHPVYSDFDYEEYSFKKQWEPLFSKEQRRIPNYYSRLIKALPKPYKTGETGNYAQPGELLDKDGKNAVKVLDSYKVTKTHLNDDGSFGVILENVEDTRDMLHTKGYYLSERPLEIPRSFDHPFLKSRNASFVESGSSLMNVFPSVETILEHAIPTTTDPYGEAQKYLKLYDVSLSSISWSSWKERFPPAEYRDVPIPRKSIDLKKDENEKPAEILLKLYDDWNSAYDPRYWLTLQSDSGTLVSKLLLSNSNSTGSLSSYPFTEINYTFPDSPPEICQNLLTSFDTFLESGLYRPFKKGGKCVPITTILQEKTALMYSGRIPWKESTKHEIVTDYQKILKKYSRHTYEEITKYDKFEPRKDSQRRTDVLAIMKDPQRENEDKAEALEKIVKDLELTDKLYFDAAKDYVMCSHTLEILKGVLKETRSKFKFYEEWTANTEGSRICKYCGEEINNDTLVAVKEYDSEGHLTMEYESLSSEIQTVISLNSLKNLFDEKNGGESLLYIVLSFLQIIPIEQQIIPILQLIRNITENLKKRSKLGKISQDDSDYAEGLMGIAGLITILQTHNPFLIPKRKVGPKTFETFGYPREEGDQILKSIINLLLFISKSFPILFKGSISVVIRKILKNTEEFKIDVDRFIKKFYEQFKTNFESAKERYIKPEKDENKNVWTLPLKVFQVSLENPSVECKTFKMNVSTRMRKQLVLHKPLPLETKFPSPSYKLIKISIQEPLFKQIPKQEITKNIDLGLSGFPFENYIKTADGVGYITISNQILTILRNSSFSLKDQEFFRNKLRTLKIESSSLFRDIAKGIFLELLATIKKSQPLVRLILNAIKTDLTLKLLLTSAKEAKQEEDDLIAKERNYVKASLRAKTDIEREVYDQLLKLGIADFIVTTKDREKFFKDYEDVTQLPDEEDGTERDYVENGNHPVALDGTEMQVDYGDYGDRAVLDYNDYTTQEQFAVDGEEFAEK
jgi:hypothetical protein